METINKLECLLDKSSLNLDDLNKIYVETLLNELSYKDNIEAEI
jgi:hypothetical protein